jgi:hypothetical protein
MRAFSNIYKHEEIPISLTHVGRCIDGLHYQASATSDSYSATALGDASKLSADASDIKSEANGTQGDSCWPHLL